MSNSKYNFWTWLVAIVLAIYLFWQWQHGHGLGSAAGCCGATVAEVPAAPVAAPEAVAPEAFQFTADTEKFQSSGNAGSVAWYAKNVDLVSWLKAGGADWQASGNDHSVTLTGTVANEAVSYTHLDVYKRQRQRGACGSPFFHHGGALRKCLRQPGA